LPGNGLALRVPAPARTLGLVVGFPVAAPPRTKAPRRSRGSSAHAQPEPQPGAPRVLAVQGRAGAQAQSGALVAARQEAGPKVTDPGVPTGLFPWATWGLVTSSLCPALMASIKQVLIRTLVFGVLLSGFSERD
jgi:hypothetical protein